MCCISHIITISIFSVNYVFLINDEYSVAWITMWLFPICIIVLYEICLYFELSQTEIEDMILLISTIFIVILVLLFSIHILAFYYKSVLIFLLIYKLYLSVYTLKFCFFMATFICSFTIVNTLLIVELEQFEIGCNKIRRDVSTRHSHIVKFFVLVVTFIRYAKIYNLSHVFFILLFKLTFFVSVTLFFFIIILL